MTDETTLGDAARPDRVSYWVDSTPETSFPPLPERVEADVMVVGAGIVGLSCAVLLSESGMSVVVVEADRIARGVSGYTTAKLTAGHGLMYSHLEHAFDEETARLYAESQTEALTTVRRFVDEYEIDCALETRANVVYAGVEEDIASVEAEAEAAARAGLAAELVSDTELPFLVLRAVRLPEQAQFHPRAYLLALAAEVERGGGRIFEASRVHDLIGTGPYEARTGGGVAVAERVVIATHYPIVEHGFFATRVHSRRSYVVAAPLADGADLEAMYINSSAPTRSLRTAPLADGGRLLLVGGQGHPVGQGEDTDGRYEALEEFMRANFDVGETRYRWSTQDPTSVDRLPYVGEVEEGAGVFVATGFGGWGMSNGTLSAMLLCDAVRGVENAWSEIYALDRGSVVQAARRFLTENTRMAAHQLAGAAHRDDADLAPGEGAVVVREEGEIAISREPDGTLHAVSARCTHMGCVVEWNETESSWDCPCHGSRFAPDGRVLHGPAADDLEALELPAEELARAGESST